MEAAVRLLAVPFGPETRWESEARACLAVLAEPCQECVQWEATARAESDGLEQWRERAQAAEAELAALREEVRRHEEDDGWSGTRLDAALCEIEALREELAEAEDRAKALAKVSWDATQRRQSAERQLEQAREALSWALDVLEISLKRIDTIDGDSLSPEHFALRAAGLAKARRALAAAEHPEQS